MVALLFMLSLLTPRAPVARAIHVVFVEPPGEVYSQAQADRAMTAIDGAVAFWGAYAHLHVTSTQIISPSGDIYADLTWSLAYVQPAARDVTVFILDNQHSGGRMGEAQEYYGAVWATVYGDILPAVLSHELGHVLFGLPDWYRVPGACTHPDIMCDHVAAYARGFIGCESLAWIGQPCHRMYVP
jgi:hypothetical protein